MMFNILVNKKYLFFGGKGGKSTFFLDTVSSDYANGVNSEIV